MGFFSSQMHSFRSMVVAESFRPLDRVYGCCQSELKIVQSSVYDWSRLGVFEVERAEEADLLLIGGWLNDRLVGEIKQAYQQMARPRFVIAIGACVVSGSPYGIQPRAAKTILASDVVPVDIYVPGCPPRPEVILDAIQRLRQRIQPGPDQMTVLQEAMKNQKI